MVTNLMELPTPVLSTEEDNKKASTCDYSNCEEMAVCYCIQCEQKICDTHQQVNDRLSLTELTAHAQPSFSCIYLIICYFFIFSQYLPS